MKASYGAKIFFRMFLFAYIFPASHELPKSFLYTEGQSEDHSERKINAYLSVLKSLNWYSQGKLLLQRV